MADLLFVGQFIASKAGKTGLTVTVDVDRYALADGSRTALVTAGSATEGRRGLYHYRLASADLATYQYVTTFITADATVDQQEIAALGLVVPDALVGSRLAPATAGRTLDVDASGNAAANVTKQAGVAVAAADANGNVLVNVRAWDDDLLSEGKLSVRAQMYEDGNYIDLSYQAIRDAMLLAASAGAPPPAAGSVDAKLNAATNPADPWAATLPGGYAGQEAGAILGRLAELDTTAVTQVSSSLAGHLTITRGLTFAEAVTGLTIPVDWEAAYWTLKRNPVQPDTAALVRLLVTNPAGESDGLQRLNGAEPASPITVADGTLTVTQATGRIDIWLSDELTACLSAGTSLGWDVKFIDSAGDSTGRRGTADVVLTETHATA